MPIARAVKGCLKLWLTLENPNARPVWQAELSGAQHRGAFVNAEGIFLGLGITIALLVDFGFFFVGESSVSWRFPFAFQLVFLLMIMGFVFTLPESRKSHMYNPF